MTKGQRGSLLFRVTVHGPPVGKARARIVEGPKGGKHGFTPEGTDTWEGVAVGASRVEEDQVDEMKKKYDQAEDDMKFHLMD